MDEQSNGNRWGIILAGGEGSRLRTITELVGGRGCPKQFCRLLGRQTLYERTEERASLLLPRERLIPVVTRSHAPFFPPGLARRSSKRMVIQPANRGTAAAIVYGLLRVEAVDRDAEVAILPCDHWVSDDAEFMCCVSKGFEALRSQPDQVVLLGAEAKTPETQYGWIESEAEGGDADRRGIGLQVKRFWEKPTREETKRLWRRGWLWNTFVIVARASTLLKMIARERPQLMHEFSQLRRNLGTDREGLAAQDAYRRLPRIDFSSEVLRATQTPLRAVAVRGVEWSDLGDPARLAALAAIAKAPATVNGPKKTKEMSCRMPRSPNFVAVKRLQGDRRHAQHIDVNQEEN